MASSVRVERQGTHKLCDAHGACSSTSLATPPGARRCSLAPAQHRDVYAGHHTRRARDGNSCTSTSASRLVTIAAVAIRAVTAAPSCRSQAPGSQRRGPWAYAPESSWSTARCCPPREHHAAPPRQGQRTAASQVLQYCVIPGFWTLHLQTCLRGHVALPRVEEHRIAWTGS